MSCFSILHVITHWFEGRFYVFLQRPVCSFLLVFLTILLGGHANVLIPSLRSMYLNIVSIFSSANVVSNAFIFVLPSTPIAYSDLSWRTYIAAII